MKEVTYKLKTPINGIEKMVLYAPTRKQMKFALFIKSSFMAIAMEMAEKMKSEGSAGAESDDNELDGDSMLAALHAGSTDVGDMIERFQSACTNTPMCKIKDGLVPDDFWDDMEMGDVEGLFAEFLGNFITI